MFGAQCGVSRALSLQLLFERQLQRLESHRALCSVSAVVNGRKLFQSGLQDLLLGDPAVLVGAVLVSHFLHGGVEIVHIALERGGLVLGLSQLNGELRDAFRRTAGGQQIVHVLEASSRHHSLPVLDAVLA